MNFEQALVGYLNAYNAKQAVLNNPLNDSSVIPIEQTKITGEIPLSLVSEFDNTLQKINTDFPKQVDDLDSLLLQFKPKIVEFFSTVAAPGTEVVMPTGQKISANDDDVFIDGIIDEAPPDV